MPSAEGNRRSKPYELLLLQYALRKYQIVCLRVKWVVDPGIISILILYQPQSSFLLYIYIYRYI